MKPGPVQQPHVPLLIAGGGERVTRRQVARYADISNFGAFEATGGARTLEDLRRKCEALRRHCEALERPYEAILKSYPTVCLELAKTPARAREKLERIPKPFWTSGFTGTPSEAITYFQALVDCGMQYFTPFVFGADLETCQLLAERVVPELGYR